MNQRKAGVILSYLSMGANSLIGFIYVPMLISFLTKSQYGLYELMGSVAASLGLLDLALASTITKYYSQALERRDKKEQENVLAVSAILYGGIGLFVLLLGIIFYLCIDPLYSKSLGPVDLLKAKQIFLILLFNLFISIPSHVFTAAINSHERFIFVRGVNLLKILLQPLIVYGVLSVKADVLLLVITQVAMNLMVIAMNIYYSFARLKISFKLHEWSNRFAGEVLLFSSFIFIHILMDQVYWRSGAVILGAVSGTVAVAVYAVGMQISSFYLSISSGVSGVFLPKISSLCLRDNADTEINKIFIKTGRLQFVLASLILSGFIIFGLDFIYFWLGGGFNISYYVAVIIMSAYFLDVVQNTGIAILQAKNKHAARAYIYTATALLNIIIGIPLGKLYGPIGCAIATGVCLFLGKGLIINLYYIKQGVAVGAFFREIGKMALPVIAVGLAGWWLNAAFPTNGKLLFMIAKIGIYSALFALVLWVFALNAYEKDLFIKPARSVWGRISR